MKQKPTVITKRSLYSWVFGANTKLQLVLLVIVLATIVARVFPLEMQKRIVNVAIGMKDIHALFLYCGLYIGAVLLAGVLKYAMNVLQGLLGHRTLREVRVRLFEHVLSLPMGFFRKTSPGLVVSALTAELEGLATFVGQAVSVPAVNIGTFFAMAGYMFYLNPMLALVSLAAYPLEILVLPRVQRRFNDWNQKRINHTRKISGLVGESVTGIQEVHANGSRFLEGRKFDVWGDKLYKANVWLWVYKFGMKFVNNLFQSMGPFILFLVGGWLAIHGRFDLGALVAFLSAYEKVYDPWKELMEFYQMFQDTKVRYAQVMNTFDRASEYEDAPVGRDPYRVSGRVEVRDVSFVVEGNIKLLDRINLTIDAGEHVALVGFSGSGKSTLALVISQLYPYTSGSVTIDGFELNELTKRDMVHNLGMVAQHPFVFDGTVAENLAYSCEALAMQGGRCSGGERPDLDRLIQAVQQVGLFQDVLRFGMRATLKPEEHAELVAHVISARKSFIERFSVELAGDMEFFAPDRFSDYSSMLSNIILGVPANGEFGERNLHETEFFRSFLDQAGLTADLQRLGAEIVSTTMDVLGMENPDAEMLDRTPIPGERYAEYAALYGRLDAGHGKLSDDDRRMLLRLALDFIPGSHKLAAIDDGLRARVVAARQGFMERAEAEHPGVFLVPGQDVFMPSWNLLDNILYGRTKTDSAGAEDRIAMSVMQLLIEEGVLEDVVAMGLEFEVGSMGDRLSGGQRQKIALARTFLKSPPLMVLDEATSALDNASQARIQNLLRRNYRGVSTVIAVVHRLDTLVDYDTVVVMKAGKIIEKGPYDTLIASKGALYELVHGK
jgi:ABC-type multidrug transport system fused ATPase/permease subunit